MLKNQIVNLYESKFESNFLYLAAYSVNNILQST